MSKHVWKLANGAFVHPICREPYQREREQKKQGYIGIVSAIYPGFQMSRFQLCDHCEAPIWDAPKIGGAK